MRRLRIRRSLLFIPGNNPNMMINAPVLGADTVIFDLEDAVSHDDKDAARVLVRNALRWIKRGDMELCVRVNDIATPYWEQDFEMIIPAKPDGLIIPMVNYPDKLEEMSARAGRIERGSGLRENQIKFLPIIETAMGIENAFAIAQSCRGRLDAMMIGGEDLATDLVAIRDTKDNRELLYGRGRVLNAARAAGLTPIDTAYADVEDIEAFTRDTMYSRQIGYAGRGVVSPRQVRIANEAYSPSAKDIEYAREVMEVYEEGKAAGKGAVSLRGKMIDTPILIRARQVLAFAEMMKGRDGNG